MTTFYLIRHTANDLIGNTIAGRKPGVHLNELGRRQAHELAQRLSTKGIQAVFSSPLERAVETAQPLARTLGLDIQITPAINEIDFGDWTGRTVAELDQLPEWKQWNQFRSGMRIPNGELMAEVQDRMVTELARLARSFDGTVAGIVSHADPLRSALAYFLGLPLDLFHRLEISPGSVTILTLHNWGPQIKLLNWTPW